VLIGICNFGYEQILNLLTHKYMDESDDVRRTNRVIKYNKHMVTIVFCIIISALFCIGFYLWQRNTGENDSVIENFDFVVIGGEPTVLYNGDLYQYKSNIGWEILTVTEKVKQVFTCEQLEYLDVAGKIHCDEYMKLMNSLYSSKENIPLLPGHYFDSSKQIYEINQKEAFEMVNGQIHGDFRALLESNTIIYHNLRELGYYEMDEAVRMLSGDKILTMSGNVYRLYLNDDAVSPLKWTYELQLVHDDNDIVHIDGTSVSTVGVNRDGKAVLWSIYDSPDISAWNNIVTAVHGDSFVAALTNSGSILFKHYEKEISVRVESIVGEWTDIVDITAYYSRLFAIDKYGNCYEVDCK